MLEQNQLLQQQNNLLQRQQELKTQQSGLSRDLDRVIITKKNTIRRNSLFRQISECENELNSIAKKLNTIGEKIQYNRQ